MELEFAVIRVIGARVTALPEEIDRSFYNVLMEMDENPAKKKAYLDSIAQRISQEALKAAGHRSPGNIVNGEISDDLTGIKENEWKKRRICRGWCGGSEAVGAKA